MHDGVMMNYDITMMSQLPIKVGSASFHHTQIVQTLVRTHLCWSSGKGNIQVFIVGKGYLSNGEG